MRICSECQAEYEEKSNHVCWLTSDNRGPVAISIATRHGRHEDLTEETLDFRFHVEKQEDPNIGKVIADRYRIDSVVGRGGMGMVYKADHLTIDRTVAIKMLYPNVVADAEAVKQFRQEAQAVTRAEHPHSVRIYDFGMSDTGQPYLVMDFIDGCSLRRLMKEGPINIARVEDIFTQVIDALAVAHKVGVIHRDLKPENIMLCERSGRGDYVQVLDFGISSLASNQHQEDPYGAPSKKSEVRGSPPYMSPEQCVKGSVIDARSDIYSLAIVIYEAISARLPYGARNPLEMMDAHVSGKPLPLTSASPSLSACEALAQILLRAMEKNPDKRQQTIEEFGRDLKEAVRRDQIHLSYLKNRKDSLSSSHIPALKPEDFANENPVAAQDPRAARTAPSPIRPFPSHDSGSKNTIPPTEPKNIWHSLVNTFSNIPAIEAEEEEPAPESKYVFLNCPHCSEPVEAGIAFCLSCGRSLATTQDFSKIRAAQGVFTLPKSQDTLSSSIPALSQRARAVDPISGAIRKANRHLMIVSLILLISIFWVAGGVDIVAKAVAHIISSKAERAE